MDGIKKGPEFFIQSLSDPAGTRTQGPNIKSVVLYQLSYEISPFFWECKKTVQSPLSQKFLDAG